MGNGVRQSDRQWRHGGTGNSIGTITVGNFTLGAGAVFEVEVNAAGRAIASSLTAR
ncbi:MAG: hypothetical protein R3D01_05385 [Hyphomicrobiales bacterium]